MIDAITSPLACGALIQPINVVLSSITRAAQDVNIYTFQALDGASLPAASAGAHVDVMLPNSLTRQYSLLEAAYDAQVYTIAVKKDPNSRGGSRYLHEMARVGMRMTISAPRNNFPLIEDAPHSVLIAGGIGVTPILCMARRLHDLGRSMSVYYSSRTQAAAAFRDDLIQLSANTVVHIDDEQKGVSLDLADIIAAAPEGSHIYCCGPAPMLEAFKRAGSALPSARIHVEYFANAVADGQGNSFTVRLARTGIDLEVTPDTSILKAVLAAGVNVPHSCEQGVCGACETKVLGGRPDHRDQILTQTERDASKSMMICCSRSLSDRLALDL